MILSYKRIRKALIRLCWCSGWSVPLLSANPWRQVFSHRGPFLKSGVDRSLWSRYGYWLGWENADLLALLCVLFHWVFVTFPYGVLGQVSVLIALIPGLEVIKLEYSLRLKIKRNHWLLADTRVRKQPIIALYFESENKLKLYNLEVRFLPTTSLWHGHEGWYLCMYGCLLRSRIYMYCGGSNFIWSVTWSGKWRITCHY